MICWTNGRNGSQGYITVAHYFLMDAKAAFVPIQIVSYK